MARPQLRISLHDVISCGVEEETTRKKHCMIHQGVLLAQQLCLGMGLSFNVNKGKSKVSIAQREIIARTQCMQEEQQ